MLFYLKIKNTHYIIDIQHVVKLVLLIVNMLLCATLYLLIMMHNQSVANAFLYYGINNN